MNYETIYEVIIFDDEGDIHDLTRFATKKECYSWLTDQALDYSEQGKFSTWGDMDDSVFDDYSARILELQCYQDDHSMVSVIEDSEPLSAYLPW